MFEVLIKMKMQNNLSHNPNVDGVHMHLENKVLSRHFFVFIWVMYSVVYMTKNCYSAATAAIVSEGLLTKAQTGLITAMFYLVYTPLQIVGGIFADKYNPEKMIKIGLVGSGIANAVIFFNQNYYVMLVTWVLNAVVQFALWPSVFKIISSQLVRSDRKQMVFFISFSNSAGLLLAYVTAAFITKWQYNFALSSVLLFSFAIAMHFYYDKYVEYKMLPDRSVSEAPDEPVQKENSTMSALKMFFLSGFIALAVVVFFKCTIEQGIKTLAPTMLMESYDNISVTFGNLMGALTIVSGIIGTILVKKVLYPRYIKNEIGGCCLLIALTIPFAVYITRIGKAPVLSIVASMCIMAVILTATQLLSSYFNMRFTKYGLNGTAAGIANAAGSLGIVLYSYGFGKLADNFGWIAVLWIIVAILIVAAAVGFAGYLMCKSFDKKNN